MDFDDAITEINLYEINHSREYGKLLIHPLKELGMPEHLLALLEAIVSHFNALPVDEEIGVFPNDELIYWFKKTINQSKSWNDLEAPLRFKLLDICREP